VCRRTTYLHPPARLVIVLSLTSQCVFLPPSLPLFYSPFRDQSTHEQWKTAVNAGAKPKGPWVPEGGVKGIKAMTDAQVAAITRE